MRASYIISGSIGEVIKTKHSLLMEFKESAFFLKLTVLIGYFISVIIHLFELIIIYTVITYFQGS